MQIKGDRERGSLATVIQRRFRGRRMRAMERMFNLQPGTHVIDIGGTPHNWSLIRTMPQISMVNLRGDIRKLNNIEMIRGDATALHFADSSFDLVYSNSVIEHVGDWSSIEAYATNVRRLAPCYYVQTPNRWFPVEPHCFGLFLHWFPLAIRRRLYRWLSLVGWSRRPSQDSIDRHLQSIRLLTARELRRLFPDATLIRERAWCFPFVAKSFILVRGAVLPARTAPFVAAFRDFAAGTRRAFAVVRRPVPSASPRVATGTK